MDRRKLNYFVDLGLAISFFASFLTGLIRFPRLLPLLGISYRQLPMLLVVEVHRWSGVVMGVFAGIHLALHWKWIVNTTKSILKELSGTRYMVVGVALVLLIVLSGILTQKNISMSGGFGGTNFEGSGRILIESFGEFSFDPANVETVRGDIFQEGHFSIFDILVYLDSRGDIDLKYRFDESSNTHIIDSINGLPEGGGLSQDERAWWYTAYYDGGWLEHSVYRIDHYPHKEKMFVWILQRNKSEIDGIHKAFREEIERKRRNDGKVIVPTVIIQGQASHMEFEFVEVKPHNLREDVFQPGVITAIDVITTLGDEGKISYDLRWYESIGSAGVVKSYWVERINRDRSYGTCGFVYESGSLRYSGSRGNHIHLPSDTRVINSPEYVEFFWICL